jgi:hypothetical protein
VKFKYGTFEHDQNTVALRITLVSLFDRFRRRMGESIRYDVVGVIKGTSQSDLTSKLTALELAYKDDYKDWTLFLDDGTTPTVHAIESADTFGGTKVLSGISYLKGPWTGRPEYANQRSFAVSLGCEKRVGEGYFSWKERLTIRGTGGPRWVYSPNIANDPQSQTLQAATAFLFIQEGVLVSREDYYAPNDPIYPLIEHEEQREITYETADDIVVGGQEMFKTHWRYVMEATTFGGFSALTVPSIT